jgi:prepilin-type N-terminal cleavage/methylation domain-containing protein/prepilin-type processing-associated H-X9-DG protein
MKRSNRYAFTLVELLVVIAIIGILVSLLLPAIQATRESARRTMCTNQIGQLILAVHDYEAAHEVYPMGTIDPQGPIKNVPNGHHISWIARILPYIDERVLYENIDLSLSAYHLKNDRPRQVTISMLICPSSSPDGPFSSYAGCHHDAEAPIDVNNRGVFFLNSKITRDDLKDGAAYTLFLGERLADNFELGWLSGTPSTLRNTGSPLNQSRNTTGANMPWLYSYTLANAQWQFTNQQVDPLTGEVVSGASEQKAAASEGESNEQNSQAPAAEAPEPDAAKAEKAAANAAENAKVSAPATDPELVPDKNGILPHSRLGGNTATPLAVGGFASSHIGGVNFAFGDGSVRFVSDTAAASLLGRLANRADGQIIDSKEW